MSGTTDNLGIAEVAANQTNKELIISTGLNALDDATQKPLPITFVSNALTLTATEFTRNYAFIGGNLTATGTLTVPATPRQFGVVNTNGTYDVEVTCGGSSCVVAPDSFNIIYSNGTNCYVGAVDSTIDIVVNAAPFLNSGTIDSGETITAATIAAQHIIGNGSASAGGVPQALSLSSSFTITGAGGTLALAPTLDLTGLTEVKVPTPVNAADAVTKAYADAAIQGLQVKPTAKVVTTAALPTNTYSNGSSGVGATLTMSSAGALTIDGYTTALNDVILVSQEATEANNGLYTVTTAGTVSVAAVLTRSIDMDASAQFGGAIIAVSEASATYPGTLWLCNQTAPTVGTTSITFTQMNPPGAPASGTGISVSGTTVSLATVSDKNILSNISGSTAAPVPNTLTAILDDILSSSQGAVIVRGASGWEAITAGTSGYALISNGTSTVPSWQAQSGGGGSGEWNAGTVNAAISTQFTINSGTLELITGPTILATGNTAPVIITANTAVPTPLSSELFEITAADGSVASMGIRAFGNNSQFIGARADGTEASPSAINATDVLFQFSGQGYNGTSYVSGARLSFAAAENWSGSTQGSQARISTRGTAGAALTTKLQVGNVTLVNAAGVGAEDATGNSLQVTGGQSLDNLKMTGTLASFPLGAGLALNSGSVAANWQVSGSITALGSNLSVSGGTLSASGGGGGSETIVAAGITNTATSLATPLLPIYNVPTATTFGTLVNGGSISLTNYTNGPLVYQNNTISSGDTISGVFGTIPTGNWTYTVCCTYLIPFGASNGATSDVGIGLSDGTKYAFIEIGMAEWSSGNPQGAMEIMVSQWTNSTSFHANQNKTNVLLPNPIWLRIVYNASTPSLTWQYSIDNFNWQTIYSESGTLFLTPTMYGMGGDIHNNNNSGFPMTLSFNYLHIG